MSYRSTNTSRPLWVLTVASASLCGLAALVGWAIFDKQLKFPFHLNQRYLAHELTRHLEREGEVPSEIEIPIYKNDESRQKALVHSTLREDYSAIVRRYLNRYKPDYGAMAVINADTGAVLAMESYVKSEQPSLGQLSLKAPFPAASVFKIVTAAAAIDQGKAYSETVIPFNGRNHTLFKRQVKDNSVNRWTRHITLREAFGRSINTIFGKLGLFHVGFEDLNRYAEAFQFNKEIPSELLIEKSRFQIDPENSWHLVESSAGYTRRTTLSPLHGAMIAAAILNDGVMKAPFFVDSVVSDRGETLYQGGPKELESILVPYSARQMQLLMEETVFRGTSRQPFRGLASQDSELILGGKTGSLTGRILQGRTDWFVGYGAFEGQRLAIGVVTVHKKYWTVKSSMLARLFFEDAFREDIRAARQARRAQQKAQK
jgi:penicillin-binding protein A